MPQTDVSSIQPNVGVKKTRRRPRVSCVECTKRRQKCDRQHPCGLCVSRDVAHLCRWESGPVARPVPARPPVIPQEDKYSELMLTIKTLSERIATLERGSSTSDSDPVPESMHSSTSSTPPPNMTLSSDAASVNASAASQRSPPLISPDRELHEAAITLAQLSLGNHGEYMGNGSVVCALYELGGDPAHVILPYSKSTESTSTNIGHTYSADPVQALARNLPSKKHTEDLISIFFSECNWCYGIPEGWFRVACSNMWRALDAWNPREENINANWLSLLFMVLALTPSSAGVTYSGTNPASREVFFMHAMSARRLAEDALFIAPSFSNGQAAAEGTVLGCIAAVLMGTYLGDRGRVSEAWKLIGGAIRAAQAAGMHRDPLWEKWGGMCEEERLLRRRGWWSLVIWDRLFSDVLGRPGMIQGRSFDVPLPSQNGSEDPFDVYQKAMAQLSELVDEVDQRYLCSDKPSYSVVLDIDRRFEEWGARSPLQLQRSRHPLSMESSASERDLERQRKSVALWYLACRMNLHRPWLMRNTPPTSPPLSGSLSMGLNPSRERCLSLAMELVRIQCAAGNTDTNVDDAMEDHNFCPFFLFDGTVNIVCALAFSPGHAYEQEALELVDHAINVLSEAGKDEQKGEISRRSVAVLSFLKRSFVRTVSVEDNTHQGFSSPAQGSNGEAEHVASGNSRSGRPASTGVSPLDQQQQFTPTAPFTSTLGFSLSPSPHQSGSVPTPYAAGISTHFPTSSSVRAGEMVARMHTPSTPYVNGISPNLESSASVKVGIGRINWGTQGETRSDVLTMLPFDILQEMPLDEDWRLPSL